MQRIGRKAVIDGAQPAGVWQRQALVVRDRHEGRIGKVAHDISAGPAISRRPCMVVRKGTPEPGEQRQSQPVDMAMDDVELGGAPSPWFRAALPARRPDRGHGRALRCVRYRVRSRRTSNLAVELPGKTCLGTFAIPHPKGASTDQGAVRISFSAGAATMQTAFGMSAYRAPADAKFGDLEPVVAVQISGNTVSLTRKGSDWKLAALRRHGAAIVLQARRTLAEATRVGP